MPLSFEEHLENLLRHIDLVREACLLMGRRLIGQGRQEFGRQLIARGYEHDVSKFSGIEWEYLHTGPDVSPELVELAIRQHVRSNSHHPEYWGGFEHMPEFAVAEMVCDWYARSQEFGTALREWITDEAIERFRIDVEGQQYAWVQKFVCLLLQDTFVPSVPL